MQGSSRKRRYDADDAFGNVRNACRNGGQVDLTIDERLTLHSLVLPEDASFSLLPGALEPVRKNPRSRNVREDTGFLHQLKRRDAADREALRRQLYLLDQEIERASRPQSSSSRSQRPRAPANRVAASHTKDKVPPAADDLRAPGRGGKAASRSSGRGKGVGHQSQGGGASGRGANSSGRGSGGASSSGRSRATARGGGQPQDLAKSERRLPASQVQAGKGEQKRGSRGGKGGKGNKASRDVSFDKPVTADDFGSPLAHKAVGIDEAEEHQRRPARPASKKAKGEAKDSRNVAKPASKTPVDTAVGIKKTVEMAPPPRPAGAVALSTAERKALQEKLNALDEDAMDRVFSFLENDIENSGEDDVELDLSKLPPARQRAIVDAVERELRMQAATSTARTGAASAPAPAAVGAESGSDHAASMIRTWEECSAREVQRQSQLREARESASRGHYEAEVRPPDSTLRPVGSVSVATNSGEQKRPHATRSCSGSSQDSMLDKTNEVLKLFEPGSRDKP